jgi:hypothetical protein
VQLVSVALLVAAPLIGVTSWFLALGGSSAWVAPAAAAWVLPVVALAVSPHRMFLVLAAVDVLLGLVIFSIAASIASGGLGLA